MAKYADVFKDAIFKEEFNIACRILIITNYFSTVS